MQQFFLDGSAFFFLAMAVFSLVLALFLLILVPLYPNLALRYDKGGALGIPRFAETWATKGALSSWPFNEYAVVAPRSAAGAVRVDTVVGDYLYLLLSDEAGNKTGVRVSVDPAVRSFSFRMKGDEVVAVQQDHLPTLSPSTLHRLEGVADQSTVRFFVDGNPVGTFALESPPAQWLIVTGNKSSRIVACGVGPSLGGLKVQKPWRWKIALTPVLTTLIFLALTILFPGLSPAKKWSGSIAWLAAAAMLYFPSTLTVVVVLGVALFVALSLASLLMRMVFRLTPIGRKKRTPLKYGPTVLFISLTAIFMIVLAIVSQNRSEKQNAISEPATVCPSSAPAPEQPSRQKRVVVYGSSTAIGEGLRDPDVEGFAGRLDQLLGDSAHVELRAMRGAPLRRILEMQREEPLDSADLVLLYTTFNDAMFSNGKLANTLFEGKGFKAYRYSYDASDFMAQNYRGYHEKYESLIRTFVQTAKQSGARVLLIGELCADQVIYHRREHAIKKFYRSLQNVAESEDSAFFDASLDFEKYRDDVLFIDAMHLNERGHCLLAKSVYPVVAQLLNLEAPQP